MNEAADTSTEELFSVNLSEADLARFWSKVNKDGPVPEHCPELGQCWEWVASKSCDGYGKFSVTEQKGEYRDLRAHRVSHFLAFGPFPNQLMVCHRCDFRRCQNPQHTFLGTTTDNMRDAAKKGRMATGDKNGSRLYPERLPRGKDHYSQTHPEKIVRGERSGSRRHPESRPRGEQVVTSKLKSCEVVAIREALKEGALQQSLAEIFKCDRSLIGLIKNGKAWRHLL